MNKVRRNLRENVAWLMDQPIDVKISLLQEVGGLCKILINDLLDEFVEKHTGPAYSRSGEFYRHGSNPSSLKLNGERLAVNVPRIRDRQTGSSYNLPEFKELQEHVKETKAPFMESLLAGLSTRNYDGVVGRFLEGFGLSKSSVSREFVSRSRKKLRELQERDLSSERYVALMIDGKSTLGDQIIIAMGITEHGTKKVLGLVQSTTENHKPVKALLVNIIKRGFRFSNGILVVLDGSKGLRKAVRLTFGSKAIVQRCQWHKRENVLSYLPKKDKAYWKGRLSKAYKKHEFKEAKAELKSIMNELKQINISAANSLNEGLNETLTLQKLGLSFELSRSLSTTNCIENLNGSIQRQIRNNTKWQSSDHLQRWIAAACLKAELSMRKIVGCKKLPKLQKAIKKYIKKNNKRPNLES